MIVFDLTCKNNHTFEGWFDDNDSFEQQKEQGFLTCPVCDCPDVYKSPTTFGMVKNQSVPIQKKVHQEGKVPMNTEILKKEIQSFIEKEFDNVGSDFTKEALKMHYGVKKPRNIRGSSTEEDDRMLKKEGIPVVKFPIPERTGDS